MSQSSFLEDVSSWNAQQCKANIQDALPKLINCFMKADSEGQNVLNLICTAFIPVTPINSLEESIFSVIHDKVISTYDGLLDKIDETVKLNSATFEMVSQSVTSLLKGCTDIVESLETCLACLLQVETGVEIGVLHSLPYMVLHVIKKSYHHCKVSSDVYGDHLGGVTDQLSSLFKSTHCLQMKFLGLLDRLTLLTPSEADVQDMCHVLHGLYDISCLAVSLDIKIMVTMWKALSRLSCQHKEHLCDRLDIGTMLAGLCEDMTSSYIYLRQTTTQQGQSGCQTFLKSVKILGFQMKVLVTLVKEYQGHLGPTCIQSCVSLMLIIQSGLTPGLESRDFPPSMAEEVERHVGTALEPLLSHLIPDPDFMVSVTRREQDCDFTLWMPLCLTLLKVMDALHQHTDDVQEKWLVPMVYEEDIPRNGLMQAVLHTVPHCYTELSVPVTLPPPSPCPRHVTVTLYQHVCTRLSAFVASHPARHFHLVEEILVSTVVSRCLYSSLLAVDVWSFLARYGSAELCRDHCHLLTRLFLSLKHVSPSPECCHLVLLLRRMVRFLAPEHQLDYVKAFTVQDHPSLYSVLPLPALPDEMLPPVVRSAVTWATGNIHNWVSSADRTLDMVTCLTLSLNLLTNIYTYGDISERHVTDSQHATLRAALSSLVLSAPGQCVTWPQGALRRPLALALRLLGLFIPDMNNAVILKLLRFTMSLLKTDDNCDVTVSVTRFLSCLGNKVIAVSPEQPEILRLTSRIFSALLGNANAVTQQVALECFAQFAEETVHESVIPESLQDGEDTQLKVVSYLNKLSQAWSGETVDHSHLDQEKLHVTSLIAARPHDLYPPLTRAAPGACHHGDATPAVRTPAPAPAPAPGTGLLRASSAEEPAAKRLKEDRSGNIPTNETLSLYRESVTSLRDALSRIRALHDGGRNIPACVRSDLDVLYVQFGDLLKPSNHI